ncbi:MAG TPA: hypothetical protein VME86_04345 [Acidobacteriaceae bacterium]|nr:hypothetical protein [Acidobacteriaceae bacterium]
MRAMVLVLAAGLFPGMAQQGTEKASAAPVQVKNSFEFEVRAPLRDVAPLFGPEGERCWAGKHWDPVFVWPQPAKDVEGAVFTVQHGEHTSVWVDTVFDPGAGRMQYVAVVPGAMTFTVDVRLSAASSSVTKVDVTYTRTALDTAANDDVMAMGKSDRANGPYWKKDIEGALARGGAGKCMEAAK